MGTRNPSTISALELRPGCETVSQMLDHHWVVISKCRKCELKLYVNLDAVARYVGPNVSLWNQKRHCKKVGCDGWATYWAQTPRKSWFEELSAPDPRA